MVLALPVWAKPVRIVSLNPCIDSVLVRVAEGRQVAAISHWSHDPAGTSLPLEVARRFPVHGGTAEEVIALRPDLVLLTPFTPLATRAALGRLGVPMVSVGVPATIAESIAQVRLVADAAGQGARGAALVREIEAGLAAARRAGQPRPALMRMASGFVPGPGSLSEALMAHAGLLSLAADRGLAGAGVLGVEALALNPPPLLITDRPGALHPVVAKLPVKVAAFDRHLLNCGGPSLVPAAARLAAIRDSLP
jgi:iron complex transport system substrate-binding protein